MNDDNYATERAEKSQENLCACFENSLSVSSAATSSRRLKVHKVGCADSQPASSGLRDLRRRFLTNAGALNDHVLARPLTNLLSAHKIAQISAIRSNLVMISFMSMRGAEGCNHRLAPKNPGTRG
jgi:hypothetical protein